MGRSRADGTRARFSSASAGISFLFTFYKSDGTKYAHSLDLDEWGVSKSWVVIAQS